MLTLIYLFLHHGNCPYQIVKNFHSHIISSVGDSGHYHQLVRFRIWLHCDVNWGNRSNLYPGELESRIFVNIENFGAIVFCERKFCECKFCECKFWKCKYKSLRKKSNTFYTIFRNICTSNNLTYMHTHVLNLPNSPNSNSSIFTFTHYVPFALTPDFKI
jgi:hypothetical protein